MMGPKTLSLMLTLALAVLSILLIQSTTAQSIPTPSTPQFTLAHAKHPYDIPAQSYHDENVSIEVTIKNQPLTSIVDASGNTIGLFYSFRYKNHNHDEWIDYQDSYYDLTSDYAMKYYGYFNATESAYTIVPLREIALGGLTDGKQVDVQVKALIGHMGVAVAMTYMGNSYRPSFDGVEGDWSPTQTITINEIAPTHAPTKLPSGPLPTSTIMNSPSVNPTGVPAQTDTQTDVFSGFEWQTVAIAILVVVVAVLAVGLAVVWRRLPKK